MSGVTGLPVERDAGDLCSTDYSRSFRQQQEESTMRKLAMSFLSELSGAWLKRRLTAAVPVKTAQPVRDYAKTDGPGLKRVAAKPVMCAKPRSSHDIASNM